MGDGGEDRDRVEVKELLEELRIGLPGVQILFAFLLTVPFTQRFRETTDLQRDVFVATLITAAVASALLIGPAAYHRMWYPHENAARLVRVATWMARGGLAALALAMSGGVFVVIDMILPHVAAAGISGGLLLLMATLWFVMPMTERMRGDGRAAPRAEDREGTDRAVTAPVR